MSPALWPALVFALATGPAAKEGWRPPELYVKPPPPLKDFDALKEIAFRFLGTPYTTGGVGNPGVDCSGFTCRVYAEAGYAIPRVSRDQVQAGSPVPLDHLRAGDLLFFADKGEPVSHVGLYLGKSELIHASTGQGEVVVADLSARWFQDRLLFARRVLTSSTASVSAPLLAEAPVRELEEHSGEHALLPMLRRPPKLAEPSYGPELTGGGVTSVGVRSAISTEDQRFGLTLAPEATLFLESIALTFSAAVPIRWTLGDAPTLGVFEKKGDYLRFLRTVSLGLPGADLQVSLSRLGDLSLLSGELLGHLSPASEVRGVPGLTVARSPLSLVGGVAIYDLRLELLLDDIVDPGIVGLSSRVRLLDGLLRAGLGYAGDQRGGTPEARRALSALEAELALVPLETGAWSVALLAHAQATRARDQLGPAASVSASVERRFGRASAISVELGGRYQGAHSVDGLFGPTYPAYRPEHLAALEADQGRPGLSGELHLRLGRVLLGGRYGRSVGEGALPIDERLELVGAVTGLSLGATRLLDLRVVYAARAPFAGGPVLDLVEAGARLRFTSWFFAEVYLQKGETLEGGAGVTVAFIP